MMQKTDERLVQKFLHSQDEAAFRELYRRHTPALYGFAMRVCGGSEADAQDLIQETWIRACHVLRGFQWKSGLRTWLTGILINCRRESNRERGRNNEEQPVPDQETRASMLHLRRALHDMSGSRKAGTRIDFLKSSQKPAIRECLICWFSIDHP